MSLSTNTGKHIQHISDSTECKKHKAPSGIPCFHIKHGSSFGYSAGVCGKRIKSAGFIGKISPTAMQKAAVGRSKRP